MKRQDKYPETSTFHYHNANTKNRITTDCVVRAISTALELPYCVVCFEMAELQCETGYDMSENKCIDMYLQSKGWVKHSQPRKEDNKKFTGKEFCDWLGDGLYINNKPAGRVVANIGGGRIVAIIDCKVWDTWDSTDGCIGIYWTKG